MPAHMLTNLIVLLQLLGLVHKHLQVYVVVFKVRWDNELDQF